jgi:hypothetical protein
VRFRIFGGLRNPCATVACLVESERRSRPFSIAPHDMLRRRRSDPPRLPPQATAVIQSDYFRRYTHEALKIQHLSPGDTDLGSAGAMHGAGALIPIISDNMPLIREQPQPARFGTDDDRSPSTATPFPHHPLPHFSGYTPLDRLSHKWDNSNVAWLDGTHGARKAAPETAQVDRIIER